MDTSIPQLDEIGSPSIPMPNRTTCQYAWVSDESIVRLAYQEDPSNEQPFSHFPTHDEKIYPSSTCPGYFILEKANILTGEIAELSSVNSQIGKSITASTMFVTSNLDTNVEVKYHEPQWSISPDKKWIIWEEKQNGVHAATLDGSKLLTWPDIEHGDICCWMNDNKHWVQLRAEIQGNTWCLLRAIVHSVDDHTISKMIALPQCKQGLVSGLTEDGSIVLSNRVNESKNLADPCVGMAVTLIKFDGNRSVLDEFEIKLPEDARMHYTCMSPDGKLMAVTFMEQNIKLRQQKSVLGIVNLGTRQFQYRVTNDLFAMAQKGENGLISSPQWTPDGSKISVICGGKLWLVPVE